MTTLQTAFAVLDIETSYESIDGKPAVSWLSFGRFKLYSIKNKILENYFFREWYELMFIFQKIKRKYYNYEVICYCHNLSFEFDFIIKNISKPTKILSNSTHGIISGKIEDCNILFKCSYKLSGYSLRKIGEMVKLPKLDAEYKNIYPTDEIPEIYKEYNERDCDIVAKYIIDIELKKYGTLSKIPLTKTGKVRHKFSEFYKLYEDDNCEWDLLPNEDCYDAMMDAFQGAITISNPVFTNIELLNVDSYDITSSYPFTMFKEQFPYTIKKTNNLSKSQISKPFWIAKIKFINIRSKFAWQWLSISKIQEYDINSARFYNGKLISCEYMIRTVTNVDFQSISDTYYFDDFEIIEFYEMEKYDYLPQAYIDTLMYFAKIKHELKMKMKSYEKGDLKLTEQEFHDLQRDYMLSKNDFNSIYGMAVQKLVQPEYTVDVNFLWIEKEVPYEYKKGKHMKRNFLYGIYILAYSRRNLLKAIIKNCPETFVYADTDSIKYIGGSEFVDTNERLQDEFLQHDYLKDLGVFDYEITYKEFKVLGAKKYCYTKEKTGDFVHLTVAGLPKKIDANTREEIAYINSIEDFKAGTLFKDCKLAKAYINNQNITYVDWETTEVIEFTKDMTHTHKFIEDTGIITNGGVVLYPTSYLLDITKDDLFIISDYQKILPQFLRKYPHLRSYLKYGEKFK